MEIAEKLAEEYIKLPRKITHISIPSELWFHPLLNKTEIALLVEIDMLDIGEKHCYASNLYLAWFCQLSERHISRMLYKLDEMDLIDLKDRHGRGRVIISKLTESIPRLRKQLQPLLAQKFRQTIKTTTTTKMSRNLDKNGEVTLDKNVQQRKEKNSISINSKLKSSTKFFYSEKFEHKWGLMHPKMKKGKQKAAEAYYKADLNPKEDKQLESYIIVYTGLYNAGLVSNRGNGEFVPEMAYLERVIRDRRFTEIDTLPDPLIKIITVGSQTEKSATIKYFKDRGELDKVKIIFAK